MHQSARLILRALSTFAMVAGPNWPKVLTRRFSSTGRIWLHCTTLSFTNPASPFGTGTSTGYGLGTFSAPVIAATITMGENRLRCRFG